MKPIVLIVVKRLFLVLLVVGTAIWFQSCNEDDPEPSQLLLTVNIDPNRFPNDFDAWLFISDKIGRTIDVRNVNDSTQVKFFGRPGNSISFTIFIHSSYEIGGSKWTSFGFESFQDITPGTTIDLKTGINNNLVIPDVIGSVPFTVENYDDSDKPEEAFFFTDGTALPFSVLDYNSNTFTGTNFSSKFFLREDPSKILVTTYRDDIPVFQWLENVKPNEVISVNFDSFVPSKTIPINKQVTQGTIKTMTGHNFATGYIFSDLWSRHVSKSSSPSALPKLGYLEGFEKYMVMVSLKHFHEHDNLTYTKAGAVPESIDLPDYTYEIQNTSLSDVSVQFSNEYTYKLAHHLKSNSESQVFWTLSSSSNEPFLAPEIPSAIKKKYPMLTADGITLQFAAYIHHPDGYTYSDYVRDYLGVTRPLVYEEFRYLLRP